ncbi:MAG: response regulator [Candidatus Obscuribacterales bacterium]|nr:response regulator [Candidatus Obscuribacterales bacterium]
MNSHPILIVDSDFHFRQRLSQMLISIGFGNIVEARSVPEAATVFGAHIALIILDYKESNGSMAWLKSIRESKNRVPVIVFSSSLGANTFSCLRNLLGINAFAEKPMKENSLLQQVNSILAPSLAQSNWLASTDHNRQAGAARRSWRKSSERIRPSAPQETDFNDINNTNLTLTSGVETTDSEIVIADCMTTGERTAEIYPIEQPKARASNNLQSHQLRRHIEALERRTEEFTAIGNDQECYSFLLFKYWAELGRIIEESKEYDHECRDRLNNLIDRLIDTAYLLGYTLIGDITQRIKNCSDTRFSLKSGEKRELFWEQLTNLFDRGKSLVNTAVLSPKERCAEFQFLPRVVLVSDNSNFDIASQLLSSANITDIFRFDHCADALVRCYCQRVDLVLIDIDSALSETIPELCSDLRKALGRSLPIGAIYKNERDLNPVGIKKSGISELIKIPLNFRMLGSKIRYMLKSGLPNGCAVGENR